MDLNVPLCSVLYASLYEIFAMKREGISIIFEVYIHFIYEKKKERKKSSNNLFCLCLGHRIN